MIRRVETGERLSGHEVPGGYPEILVYDGVGLGNGSLVFAIESFHSCAVVTGGNGSVSLVFEGKTSVTFGPGAVVCYALPDVKAAEQ